MKKMKTGGMTNPNKTATVQRKATGKSSGGVNTPPSWASRKATGKSSGGVNTPPKGAVPAKSAMKSVKLKTKNKK